MHHKRVITAAASVLMFGHMVATSPAQVTPAQATPAQTTPAAAPAEIKTVQQFRESVSTLASTIATLSPEQSANRWLTLVDTVAAMKQQAMGAEQFGAVQELDFGAVMTALPTPAQWPALRAAIDMRVAASPQDRRAAMLSLLIDTLQGDDIAAQTVVAALSKPDRLHRNDFWQQQLSKVSAQIAAATAQPSGQVDAFEATVNVPESDRLGGSEPDLEVPDLVTIAGKDKATELLKKALMLHRQLTVPLGDETAALARMLAVEAAQKIPAPQWRLCLSVDAVDLYEAMIDRAKVLAAPQAVGMLDRLLGSGPRRQPSQSFDSYQRREATGYYLLGLIIKGRTDDALAVAKTKDKDGSVDINGDAISALEQSGHGRELFDFLLRVAKDDPATPYWDSLIAIAAHIDKSAVILQEIQQASARTDLSPEQHSVVSSRLATALLAADHVNEGAAQLQLFIKTGNGNDTFRMSVQLATIGRITGKPAWVKQGLDSALAIYKANASVEPGLSTWIREMSLAGRQDEVLVALTDRLSAKPADPNEVQYGFFDDASPAAQVAAMYWSLGRPKDVVDWLDKYNGWGIDDLAKLQIGSGAHGAPPPLAYYVASALVSAGRTAEARPILDRVLVERGGLDAAYELLLHIDPSPVAALDALFARDPFEERPLIWKAVLARKDKKLDEAEKLLRQAITIDPSDGEEGKGDRMRVYAVLAEVLSDKGDAKQAAFFRKVVASIRASENADDAYYAGLLTRAIGMYADALTLFSDAYCIQSRLAIQLAALGRMTEAEAHYQKAYELMPDSFGRVESHCFGCERAFKGATAQGIAERTFKTMLRQHPNKPQLHYLLGYLRTEQGRYADARPEFEQAVKLDPDYLNAWMQLNDLSNHVQLPPQEQDDAALATLRLDPLGRHSYLSLSKVHDLARLYAVAQAAIAQRPPKPAKLYPFPAAAALLTKRKDAGRLSAMIWRLNNVQETTPGQMLTRVERVQLITSLLE